METMAEPDALSVLGRFLDEPIVVLDVGARWGVAPVWRRLGGGCVAIGFEPDTAECDRLNARGGGTRFVPVALAAKSGLGTLYLTRDRKGCSLYPPSPALIARHPGLVDCELESTELIEVSSMDDWRKADGIGRVDAIKIDAQGGELDVLRGGEATLRTVRVLEIEVEFNELYEGVPVFSEVDRFLRRHGFVLWKLRDLAHYAQAGADRSVRTAELCHYDDYSTAYAAGAGQLFWANAYYVRREVAAPDPAAGWQSLVRDACLSYAYGLLDLAELAVSCAGQVAPDEVAEQLAIARSAGRRRCREAEELVARSVELAGSVKVDFAAEGFAGGGWYEPQLLEAGGVRWSGPGRDAWVDVPVTAGPGTLVEILAVAFMTPEIAQQLAVDVNGVPLPVTASPHVHGTLYSGSLPAGYASERRFTRVRLRTPAPVPWRELHPESADDTELGLAVTWIRLTTPVTE